jgi:hypothetical protein
MRKAIAIDSKGGTVSADVIFGHASIGKYELSIYDATDHNPSSLLEGASDDDKPDTIDLPAPAASLVGRLLYLGASVATATSAADLASVTLAIRQGGNTLDRATVTVTLDAGEQASGVIMVRLTAQAGS